MIGHCSMSSYEPIYNLHMRRLLFTWNAAVTLLQYTQCWGADEAMPHCCRGQVGWSITCCHNGRLPVCRCMFRAVHSFSISAQPRLKILDIFEGVKQTHKQKREPVSFHWDGVIPGHLFARRPQRWACGDESVAVYFGQCLARDDDEQRTVQKELVGPMAVKAITENKETL